MAALHTPEQHTHTHASYARYVPGLCLIPRLRFRPYLRRWPTEHVRHALGSFTPKVMCSHMQSVGRDILPGPRVSRDWEDASPRHRLSPSIQLSARGPSSRCKPCGSSTPATAMLRLALNFAARLYSLQKPTLGSTEGLAVIPLPNPFAPGETRRVLPFSRRGRICCKVGEIRILHWVTICEAISCTPASRRISRAFQGNC